MNLITKLLVLCENQVIICQFERHAISVHVKLTGAPCK